MKIIICDRVAFSRFIHHTALAERVLRTENEIKKYQVGMYTDKVR